LLGAAGGAQGGVYLEYDSGTSTLYAARHVAILISVESDQLFLRAVARDLASLPRRPETELIHADIGPVKPLGGPLFARPTPARLLSWAAYADAPWRYLAGRLLEPDTILCRRPFSRRLCAKVPARLAPGKPPASCWSTTMPRARMIMSLPNSRR
jgi:hypothetical protein